MSHPRIHPVADTLAALSATATVTAWQVQLDWFLRIAATIIAIIAGLLTIRQHLKARRAKSDQG